MKIFKFFITKIFLRKPILTIGILLLVFMSNYTIFTATRSIFSTFQGFEEVQCINQKGTYIANLDPNSDIYTIEESGMEKVYDYLNNNFKYGLYTDGFIVSVPNEDDIEVSFNYINEEYYKLDQFKISQGVDLDFNYELNKDTEIPVLVGKGLSKTYPVGSTIKVDDSLFEQPITIKVVGILKQNTHHSNFYHISSKSYYNFSILVPINKEVIKTSSKDLQRNALMDIVVFQTTEEEIEDLSKIMQDNLGVKFNFSSQKENNEYFNEYYLSSLKVIVIITLILIIIIICLSIWNALVSVRLMLKDFTINLLVGLSYSKLRKIFYGYFGILFFIGLVVNFLITVYSRYGSWLRKESMFVTYGLFGLIGMDWFALLVVLLFDIIMSVIIVENMLRKIKKIPISLGVLQ